VPRRHKLKYDPELLNVVLRDAQSTRSEIEREPDARKRRNFAIKLLGSIYHDAEKHGELHLLDPRIVNFCERFKARNGGYLPKSKGGQPPNQHRRLLIALAIHDKVKALGPGRSNIETALQDTSIRMGVSYDYVKEIFYDQDPEWLRAMEIERAHRKHFEG
jgi:hypothetical protein